MAGKDHGDLFGLAELDEILLKSPQGSAGTAAFRGPDLFGAEEGVVHLDQGRRAFQVTFQPSPLEGRQAVPPVSAVQAEDGDAIGDMVGLGYPFNRS